MTWTGWYRLCEGLPWQRGCQGATLGEFSKRLDAAEIIDPCSQVSKQVLFGATVTVRDEEEKERVYRIVGIDETDAKPPGIPSCAGRIVATNAGVAETLPEARS